MVDLSHDFVITLLSKRSLVVSKSWKILLQWKYLCIFGFQKDIISGPFTPLTPVRRHCHIVEYSRWHEYKSFMVIIGWNVRDLSNSSSFADEHQIHQYIHVLAYQILIVWKSSLNLSLIRFRRRTSIIFYNYFNHSFLLQFWILLEHTLEIILGCAIRDWLWFG